MITHISQSFMKSMRKYFAGEECGHLIRWMWIEGKLLPSSEAQKVGSYFEYYATGNLPKDGKVPVAGMKKSGDGALVNYRRALAAALYLKGMFAQMGLEILHTGWDVKKGRFKGSLDLVVKCTKNLKFKNGMVWKKGYVCVIDLKYSGLLDNRWSEHGWAWTDDQKRYHGTQAKQYSFLTGLPFYFWVVSSKGAEEDNGFPVPEMKVFPIKITEPMIERHIAEGNDLLHRFKMQAEIGFVARPSLSKCRDCALAPTCKDRHTFPHPEDEIDIAV